MRRILGAKTAPSCTKTMTAASLPHRREGAMSGTSNATANGNENRFVVVVIAADAALSGVLFGYGAGLSRVIRHLSPVDVKRQTVRARYTAGKVGDRTIPDYVDEEGVDPANGSETFAQVALEVDNWRWAGVPLVLRSGEALGEDWREISVHFRPVPHLTFGEDAEPELGPSDAEVVREDRSEGRRHLLQHRDRGLHERGEEQHHPAVGGGPARVAHPAPPSRPSHARLLTRPIGHPPCGTSPKKIFLPRHSR